MYAIALAVFAQLPAEPLVATSQPQPAQRHLSTAEVFELARRAESAGNSALAEQVLRALGEDPDSDIRAEARFRLGQMFARQKRWRAAADTWRFLLDEKPEAARVRLELAWALAELGDEDGARRELRRARSIGLPAHVAELVEKMDFALRSERTLGLSVEVAVAPDSNINRAGHARTVDVNGLPVELDEDAVARSGIGLSLAAQAFARPALTDKVNLLVTLGGRADLYRHGRFNQVELNGGLGPELRAGRARVRLRGKAGLLWFGGAPWSRQYGIEANVLAPVGSRSQLELDAAASRNDNRVNNAQDGWVFSTSARLERAFGPRLFGRLQIGAVRTDAAAPAYSTWSFTGQLLAARDMGRITIYGLAALGRTRADGPFGFPPERRRDRLSTYEAGLVFRSIAWRGLAPVFRISRTANESPVFFYEFKRTRLEIGVTRDF